MKKLFLSSILVASLFASEIQFGKGDFSVDAKFLGLSSSKSENITSISLVNEHKNIFSSNFFYSYKLAYFKSNTITTSADYVSSILKYFPSYTNNFLIYNKLRGVDLNVILGRDIINKDDKDTYFGVGLLVGASFPYLKTSSSSNNSTTDYLKKSKTKFYTYKLGLSLKAQKSFNTFLNVYANGNYAKQKAKVKNDVLNLDSSSSGDYFSFNVGAKFQAKTKTKVWFITLSPSLFVTAGYRYDYWKVDDVKINSLALKTDIKLKISQVYVGLGYDF